MCEFTEYDEEPLFISGDHILDPITPNIGLWPQGAENPLKDYFKSLIKIKNYPDSSLLTAHGKIIFNTVRRIEQLLEHHENRLAEIEKKAQTEGTAFSIAFSMFHVQKLTAYQWRFALAEILAHLQYLVYTNRLIKKQKNNKFYYVKG